MSGEVEGLLHVGEKKKLSRACVIRFQVRWEKFLGHVVGYGWAEDAQILGYEGGVRALVGLAVRLALLMAKHHGPCEVDALLMNLCFIYVLTGALAGMRVPNLIGVP